VKKLLALAVVLAVLGGGMVGCGGGTAKAPANTGTPAK
jgi:hypothetical protein